LNAVKIIFELADGIGISTEEDGHKISFLKSAKNDFLEPKIC
jgi:hypothetical protein